MELVFLGPQQTADPIVRAAQKVPDLRVGLLVEGFAPLFRGRECYGSNFIAHTTVFDHMPCHACCRLEIGGGAGRDKLGPKYHLLRDLPAHAHIDVGHHLLLGGAIFVFIRYLAHHAERLAPGNDGSLVDGLGTRRVQGDEGVASLVIGRQPPSLHALGQGARRPHKDLIPGLIQAIQRYPLEVLGCRHQGRLIHHVEQVGA
mmetsp:Transcript_12974/g.37269  ORF Transcript_12974/g.37269 Transcript_12974/m.37269 type:complete len:202 (+) Transcript_12974:211-816(+)